MKNAKTSSVQALALAVALFGAGGGCALSVEAEFPELEMTQHNLAFAGLPAGSGAGDVSMTRTFSQRHSKLTFPDRFDSEVDVVGVTLVAKEGVDDLTFIHEVRITMRDDSDTTTHPPIEIATYHQGPNTHPGLVLDIPNAEPKNAVDQLRTDSATFTVEVAGSLPARDWTIDFSVRLAARVKYQ